MAGNEGNKTKGCWDCPSFLNEKQADDFYGKSVGAPMCAKFGKVLGAPGIVPMAERNLQKAIASKCDGYGKPAPNDVPEHIQSTVMTPDADSVVIFNKNPVPEDQQKMVNTCRNCEFFVKPEDVSAKTGFTSGACRQTGRLLVTTRLSKEAEQCTTRKYGAQRSGMSMMKLLPLYAEAKAFDPSALGKFKKMRDAGELDPQSFEGVSLAEYEDMTGYPVDVQEAAGVRTWRPLEDTNGTGKKTFVPVFDPDSFDAEEREKIPMTGDKEHPEHYIDSSNVVYTLGVLWMEMDEAPFLWGRAGTGKTEAIRHMSWLMSAPFDRISITTEMEEDSLIGKWKFLNGETVFQRGRLPLRWVARGCLVVDEWNVGPDPVIQRLRPVFDNSKELVLDESAGEKVERHDFTFIAATGNPAWDVRNLGTRDMADADLDRMAHVYVDLPPRDVEFEILRVRADDEGLDISDEQIKKVLDISEEIRGLVDDGALPVSWGLRPNIKVIGGLQWFDPVTAYRRAVLDALDPEARDMVLKIVTSKVVW